MTAAYAEIEEGEILIEGELPHESTEEGKAGAVSQMKAKRSKQATLTTGVAGGFVHVYGPNAFPSLEITRREAIRLVDVQALLLWVLGDGHSPQWVFVKNKPLISKVVLMALPGLDAHTFEDEQHLLPNLQSLGTAIATLATGANVGPGQAISQLFHAPLSRKRKREADGPANGGTPAHKRGAGREAAPFVRPGNRGPPAMDAMHYRITLEQMEANKYPMPLVLSPEQVTPPEGFLCTEPREGDGEDGENGEVRLVGMDCEMCKVAEDRYALTRVSLIDMHGQVLLDELVVPEEPITDYVTQYSGITAAMLEGVTTRLQDVQARFRELVDCETLLVGHALENDLQAMRMIHPRVIDTSLLFPHPKGPPFRPKLKHLASKFLKRDIQNGTHDSIEDARAAMDLVLLKIRKGPAFGMRESTEVGERILDILGRMGKRVSLVDRQDIVRQLIAGTANALVCTDDEDVVTKMAKEVAKDGVDMVWGQVRALSQLQAERARRRQEVTRLEDASQHSLPASFGRPAASQHAPRQGTARGEPQAVLATNGEGDGGASEVGDRGNGDASGEGVKPPETLEREALIAIDRAVGRVWRALPPHALLLAVTLAGDVPQMRLNREMRYKRQQGLLKPPWSMKDEEEHFRYEKRHTNGLTFCCVKHG